MLRLVRSMLADRDAFAVMLDLDQARGIADDVHQYVPVRQCCADVAERVLWVFGFEFVAFLCHLAIDLRSVLALVVLALKPKLR